MRRHQHFDLWLHDDSELGALVGGRVAERTTLHEWPLSCVQRLVTDDGRTLIYKSQSAPSVEPEFYASARSSLLVRARTVYRKDGHSCMLLDLAEGGLVRDLDPSESDLVRIGRAVMAQIADILGAPPAYLEVGTERQWVGAMRAMCQGIRALSEAGKLRLTTVRLADELEGWALEPDTLAAIRGDPGYVHGDLSASNLFVLPSGYRLIDWQFPKIAPRDLDLAVLLESSGFDPRPHVGAGTLRVMWLLRIHWFVECAARWFPAGTPHYDSAIVSLASQIARADSAGDERPEKPAHGRVAS